MKTRRHVHEESFAATPEELFALLITPSAIRSWWSAARAIVLPQEGGVWTAAWGEDEDAPDYVSSATILAFDPPRLLVLGKYCYHAKTGELPFEAEFQTEFLVIPQGRETMLRVTQDGFPAESVADEFYAACQRGWRDTFAGIRRYLSGQT